MSGVPAGVSLERVSSRGTWGADNPTSPARGALVTDLIGRIAVFPLVLGSTDQPPPRNAVPDRFTDFSRFLTRLSPHFFHFFEGRKNGLLPLGGWAVSGRD
jgi:hypothetical protein